MHRRIPAAVALAIALLLVAGFATWAYFGDTVLKQSRRMKVGHEHLSAISNAVHSFSEFRTVQVGVGTARMGCFLVTGLVETREQLVRLQRVIAEAKPPLDVVYSLKILADYAENPSAEPNSSASRSQLVRVDTNRMSAAVGSGH